MDPWGKPLPSSGAQTTWQVDVPSAPPARFGYPTQKSTWPGDTNGPSSSSKVAERKIDKLQGLGLSWLLPSNVKQQEDKLNLIDPSARSPPGSPRDWGSPPLQTDDIRISDGGDSKKKKEKKSGKGDKSKSAGSFPEQSSGWPDDSPARKRSVSFDDDVDFTSGLPDQSADFNAADDMAPDPVVGTWCYGSGSSFTIDQVGSVLTFKDEECSQTGTLSPDESDMAWLVATLTKPTGQVDGFVRLRYQDGKVVFHFKETASAAWSHAVTASPQASATSATHTPQTNRREASPDSGPEGFGNTPPGKGMGKQSSRRKWRFPLCCGGMKNKGGQLDDSD